MDHKQTSNAATSKSKPKNAEKLNRFTSLPYLIDMLEKNELTLLDPSGWEDKNERITIEQYKELNGYESIYALCMTDKAETYHHWNAFTNGDSGCCIEFDKAKLEVVLEENNVKFESVEYIELNKLSFAGEKNQLPFYKRHPFWHEGEFRLIYCSKEPQKPTYPIKIDKIEDYINQIHLSSKLPEPVFKSVKALFGNKYPSIEHKIKHSTLFNNNKWANHFKNL